MPIHPITGARYPTSGNAPAGYQQIQDAVTDLSTQSVPRYANAAARDAAFAAWTAAGNTMQAGMLSFTQNDGRFWFWSASASEWRYAGGKPPAILAATVAGGFTAGSGFAPGCFRDASGQVHVVGGVTNNGSYTPSGNVMFTLPAGYNPTRDIAVLVMNATGWAIGGVYAADGSVKVNVGPALGAGTLHTVNFSFHPTFAGGALA